MLDVYLRELRQLGSAERALADKRYHKSNREHWGVPVPACEQWTRSLAKSLTPVEMLPLARDLWETNLFDPMICAAKMISLPKLKPSSALWKTILHFLKRVDGWALEDILAPVARKCILADESLLDEIEEWTQHPNFWMRRAALVYTLPYAKPARNPERMLGWAASYVSDPEWFIQKAIGWWLRVLGEHNPERVSVFLNAHLGKLKGVARKEAMRKLSGDWQKRILRRQDCRESKLLSE